MKLKLVLFSAASLASLGAMGVANAQDSAFSVSGNVALVSDYRFRGVSLSDNAPAIQGGFDVGHTSGLYIGTWASSIDSLTGSDGRTSEMELDIYGGYGFSVGELSFDLGALGYLYPDSAGIDYYEIYGSVSGGYDVLGWTLGAVYSPEQDNLVDGSGDEDDLYYVYGDLGMPLGDSGFSLSAHIGYEDGAYAVEKLDWSLGIAASYYGLDFGLSYVDTDTDANLGDLGDAGVVFSIGKSL